jgi:hypothetical protein
MTQGNAPQIGPPNLAFSPARMQRQSRVNNLTKLSRGGTTYDPDEFYTAASNSHDHSSQVGLKLPSYILLAMGQLREDYPMLASNQDFIRNAINHAIHHYANTAVALSAETQKQIDDAADEAWMALLESERERHDKIMSDFRREANAAASKGKWNTLGEMVERLRYRLYLNPDDPDQQYEYREMAEVYQEEMEDLLANIERLWDSEDDYDYIPDTDLAAVEYIQEPAQRARKAR